MRLAGNKIIHGVFLVWAILMFLILTMPVAKADTQAPSINSGQASSEQALENLKNQRAALQNNINQIQAKIDEYQKNLNTKRGEITSLKNEIARINGQIGQLDLEIKKTQNQIYLTRLNIQETQTDITTTVQTLDEKQQVLADLIRELDKTEHQSLLERLLLYKDLAEVLNQIQYTDSVQAKINNVVNQTKILKTSLEGKKVVLENNKKDLEQKNTQLAVQKSAQQTERGRKNTILTVTKGEETKYQQLLNQAEREQAEFLKALARIEEQILIEKNFVNYFQAGTIPKPGTKIFIWPEDNIRLTQGYVLTNYAKRGVYGGKGHNGIDMTAGIGSPIKAAAGGAVVAKSPHVCQNYTNPACNGYWGNWIALQHPGGLVTLYAHMTKPSPKSIGDTVETGDIIGYEGSSGNSTGSHLHFSVFTEFFTYIDPNTGDLRISYNYAKTLNPLDYL